MYKNFIVTLSSYKCDKNCPFCIAKMNMLHKTREDLNLLKNELIKLQSSNYKFKSCVISGNGEPSLYDYEFLVELKELLEQSRLFQKYRIQSSGNIFFEKEKLIYLIIGL